MTDRQEAKLDSYAATEAVLDAHPEPFDPIPAAKAAVTDFGAALADLRKSAGEQAAYASGGAAKSAQREALAGAAVRVAQSIAAWADVTGDLDLVEQMDLTETDFLTGRDQDALTLAERVLDEANAHAEDLVDYGVSAADLTALDALIEAFADALPQPRHARAERTAHTVALAGHFRRVDAILRGRLDRFAAKFKGTVFYDEYFASRRIDQR